ncbi:unnamed protein product, partial [Polarella glacialis]
ECTELKLLEAVLPTQLLAAQRCHVEAIVEKLLAEMRKPEECSGTALGWFGRTFLPDWSSRGAKLPARLMKELHGSADFEVAEPPQKVAVQIQGGLVGLVLKGAGGLDLLSLSLGQAKLEAKVAAGVDHRGHNSASWRLEATLGFLEASHLGREVISRKREHGDEQQPQQSQQQQQQQQQHWSMHLCIESMLEPTQNLLGVSFSLLPMEIFLPPGLIGDLLAFVEPPPDLPELPSAQPVPLVGAGPLPGVERTASAMLLPSNPVRAKQYAGLVYERIPDKVHVDITLASPTLHVPVAGLGTAIVSLGQLSIGTPVPCEFSDLTLGVHLSSTVLRVDSVCGGVFDVVQPVCVRIVFRQQETADALRASVIVDAGKLSLFVSPESLQLLLAVPQAITDILSAPSRGDPKLGTSVQTALEPPHAVEDSNATWTVMFGEEFAALKRAQELQAKPYRADLVVNFEDMSLAVSDSVLPILRLQLQVLPPGLTLKSEGDLTSLSLADAGLSVDVLNPRHGAWEPLLERFNFGVQVASDAGRQSTEVQLVAHGPLLVNLIPTPLRLIGSIGSVFAASLSPSQVAEAPHGSRGQKFRIINLCDMPLELAFSGENGKVVLASVAPSGSQWVGLDKLLLSMSPRHVTVRLPGGGMSEPLLLEQSGAVVVPDSQEAVVAELLTPEPTHRLLLLAPPLRVHNQTDLTLAVRFHSQQCDAIVPQSTTATCDGSLLGQNLWFGVRCISSAGADIAQTSLFLQSTSSSGGVAGQSLGSVQLPPNGFCAVPLAALSGATGSSRAWLSLRPVGHSGLDFCKVVEVGLGLDVQGVTVREPCSSGYPASDTQQPQERDSSRGDCQPCFAVCRRGGAAIAIGGVGQPEPLNSARKEDHTFHFACESQTRTVLQPSPLAITTVALKPTMVLLNALPIGNLTASFQPVNGLSRLHHHQDVQVPPLCRFNLYNIGVEELTAGLKFSARLEGGAPWSTPVSLTGDAVLAPTRSPARGLLQPGGSVGEAQQVLLEVRQSSGGAAAGVVLEALGRGELRLSCPNWLVDRTGFESDGRGSFEVRYKGAPLPTAKGITLLHTDCFERSCDLVLREASGRSSTFNLKVPPNFLGFNWDTSIGALTLSLRIGGIKSSGLLGASCQECTLSPWLVLTNSTAEDMELRFPQGGQLLKLAAGESKAHHPAMKRDSGGSTDPELLETSFCFRPAGASWHSQSGSNWSSPVLCSDGAAGSSPFSLPLLDEFQNPKVWSADVAPSRGAMAVTLRPGSDFAAANRASKRVSLAVQPISSSGQKEQLIRVAPGAAAVPIGWATPFAGKRSRAVDVIVDGKVHRIDDLRRTAVLRLRGEARLAIRIARTGETTLLSLIDDGTAIPEGVGLRRGATQASVSTVASGTAGGFLHVEVKLGQLGVSLIDEGPPEPQELLFLSLDMLRLDYLQDARQDSEELRVAISQVQVACQLPGHTDGEAADRLSLWRERPAVILANHRRGGEACLQLQLRREATSSRDLLLPFAELVLDRLDITIDDSWLQPLSCWLDRAVGAGLDAFGVPADELMARAGKPITEDYVVPQLPSVVQAEDVKISALDLNVWCDLNLRSLGFLPGYVRGALQVLSFSDSFTLDGARLKLPANELPPHRGSLEDYVEAIASGYTTDLLKNMGRLLGKSSLLNLPKVPLRLGGAAVALVGDGLSSATGEAVSLFRNLALDPNYAARKRRNREERQIHNAGDGFLEAGRSLAEGVEGLFDVFRKPVQGAREGGFKGFVTGIGVGLAGTVVKPLAAVG